MALQQEIWIKDIQDELYRGSEFINFGVDHGGFVENKTVHVPQGGAAPSIVQNRTSLPATIAQRTDSELTYDLNEYTTDPILITDIDELQTSYAKRQSVLGQHVDVLNERIGDQTAFDWAEATASVTTSGAAGTTLAPGATGTRKKVVKEDIAKLARAMDEQNIPMNDRFLMLPTGMYYELFETDALIRKDFMNTAALPKGVINEILGFKVMQRPVAVVTDAAFAKKAVGAATAATDNFGAIAWQKNYVAKALGSIKVFADMDKPEYYGSVFSALVMHGSNKLRTDSKGIVTLSQEA